MIFHFVDLDPQSPDLSGITWFNLSAIQLGLVVSGSLYGALLGSLLAYAIADFLGRKRQLIAAALLYIVGGVVTAYSPELGVLLAGRRGMKLSSRERRDPHSFQSDQHK
ncbi:D-xylose-proton symporter-like 3, chloroplastic [Vigna radiata var. radiata]|uniref:D-xylose-proton symporter-like 3, chloroplastic n=1 Tax=Vigna radiata var. radiata TaxID=3916 RepID=A0A3Q0ETC8_VIGRR|nr:D-xylose-proton symporter-like 3, chloroplastic [Vigna radiata var. radiata]